MNIIITEKAHRELETLSLVDQQRIASKVRYFKSFTDPLVFAKYIPLLKVYRFRVGDYRLFCERFGESLFIFKIARRDKAYE